MPPKRKQLAEATGNKDNASKPTHAKVAKTSAKATAPKPGGKGDGKGKTYKFCNANTVSREMRSLLLSIAQQPKSYQNTTHREISR